MKRENNSLKAELKNANQIIERLEVYNRRDNIIVTGLPLASYSEASSTISADDPTDDDVTEMSSSKSSENAFLDLCVGKLGFNVPPQTSPLLIAYQVRVPELLHH